MAPLKAGWEKASKRCDAIVGLVWVCLGGGRRRGWPGIRGEPTPHVSKATFTTTEVVKVALLTCRGSVAGDQRVAEDAGLQFHLAHPVLHQVTDADHADE